MTYKTLQDIKRHYQTLRNHPRVNLYQDSGDLVCTWNPRTREYDWFRYDIGKAAYIQTGSTEKRGSVTLIDLTMF